MSSQPQFSISGRADDLHRRWNLFIQPDYQDVEPIYRIAKHLYTIPVSPLPNPSIPEEPDLRPDMTFHESEFYDTWCEYHQTLAEYGTICHSEFQPIQLFNEEPSIRPEKNYGIRIDLHLPEACEPPLYFIAYVYANGRVACFGMGEYRYHTVSP